MIPLLRFISPFSIDMITSVTFLPKNKNTVTPAVSWNSTFASNFVIKIGAVKALFEDTTTGHLKITVEEAKSRLNNLDVKEYDLLE